MLARIDAHQPSAGSPPQPEPPSKLGAVKAPPESMKSSLTRRLNARAAQRWPDLAGVEVRFRSNFAYTNGHLRDGTTTRLCRLRYGGVLHTWGFALYLASHDDYQNAVLPTGYSAGSPEAALDCACGLKPQRSHRLALMNPDELIGRATSLA
jgi:hypothetical protein